tara:strand:+ start:110 stop:691 length:582 start_codon:yes stop_codon:yes gene_type:complete
MGNEASTQGSSASGNERTGMNEQCFVQGLSGNEAAAGVCSTRSDWQQSYSEGARWASSGVNAGDVLSSGSSYPSGGHAGNSPPQGQPGTPVINYDPCHRIKLGGPIPPTYRLMEKYDECRGPGLWVVVGGVYLDLSTGIDILDRCNKNTSGKEYFCIKGGKLMHNMLEENSAADGGPRWVLKPVNVNPNAAWI